MLKLDDQYAYTPKFLYKNKRITKKRYQELKLVMDLWKGNLQSPKLPGLRRGVFGRSSAAMGA